MCHCPSKPSPSEQRYTTSSPGPAGRQCGSGSNALLCSSNLTPKYFQRRIFFATPCHLPSQSLDSETLSTSAFSPLWDEDGVGTVTHTASVMPALRPAFRCTQVRVCVCVCARAHAHAISAGLGMAQEQENHRGCSHKEQEMEISFLRGPRLGPPSRSPTDHLLPSALAPSPLKV